MSDSQGGSSSGSQLKMKGRSKLFTWISSKLSPHTKVRGDRKVTPTSNLSNALSQTRVNNFDEAEGQPAQLPSAAPPPVTGTSLVTGTAGSAATSALGTNSITISASAGPCLPIANSEDAAGGQLVDVAVENPVIAIGPEIQAMDPICELWNAAYEDLRANEEELIMEYEGRLQGSLPTMIASTVAFSGSRLGREKLMNTILKEKMEEVKRNTWWLKYGRKEVAVKDMVEPVVGIIKWADKYISGAVGASPAASVAWVGVSLLLPVSRSFNTYFIVGRGVDQRRLSLRYCFFSHIIMSNCN